MSVHIRFDSATPQEVYDLTLAFQRTLAGPTSLPATNERPRWELPQQITTEPTVTVAGIRMGWNSPGLKPEHAVALLAEFERLQGR